MASGASIPIYYTLMAHQSLHDNILYPLEFMEPTYQYMKHLWAYSSLEPSCQCQYIILVVSGASKPILYAFMALRSLHDNIWYTYCLQSLHTNIVYTCGPPEPPCQYIIHFWHSGACMPKYCTLMAQQSLHDNILCCNLWPLKPPWRLCVNLKKYF